MFLLFPYILNVLMTKTAFVNKRQGKTYEIIKYGYYVFNYVQSLSKEPTKWKCPSICLSVSHSTLCCKAL